MRHLAPQHDIVDHGTTYVEPCTFCELRNENPRRPENTVLLETRKFTLIPALGPLTSPHLLAVAKDHARGMHTPDNTLLDDYELLVQVFFARDGAPPRQLLIEIEHAPNELTSSAPCINHCHTHWLFSSTPLLALLAADLNPTLSGDCDAYIWVRQHDNSRTFSPAGLGGNRLRKILGNHLMIEEPDWAVAPNIPEAIETVARFQRGDL